MGNLAYNRGNLDATPGYGSDLLSVIAAGVPLIASVLPQLTQSLTQAGPHMFETLLTQLSTAMPGLDELLRKKE